MRAAGGGGAGAAGVAEEHMPLNPHCKAQRARRWSQRRHSHYEARAPSSDPHPGTRSRPRTWPTHMMWAERFGEEPRVSGELGPKVEPEGVPVSGFHLREACAESGGGHASVRCAAKRGGLAQRRTSSLGRRSIRSISRCSAGQCRDSIHEKTGVIWAMGSTATNTSKRLAMDRWDA
eukprot:scaffold21487_cov105-Isochrysis_galbana.AAC.1